MTATTNGPRPLSEGEHTAVSAVAAATGVLGVLGFANSFMGVMEAARPSFHWLAWTVPLGIDLGIAIFSALDIVLARLDMRVRWLRLVPWALTGATVYLNVAGYFAADVVAKNGGMVDWFAVVAHALLPLLWVVAVEVGAHAVRVRAGLASATHMDRIRRSRWFLAPLSTASLWRRMVLWEVRSYPAALDRERARVLAKTDLQDEYGRLWRWSAPRRLRALYRLGELAPAVLADQAPTPAIPAPAPVPVIDAPMPVERSAPPPVEVEQATQPAPAPLPDLPAPTLPFGPVPDELCPRAVEVFAADLDEGNVPSLQRIKDELNVGQQRAQRIQTYLTQLNRIWPSQPRGKASRAAKSATPPAATFHEPAVNGHHTPLADDLDLMEVS